MVSTNIVFRLAMEMEEEPQNVGKGNKIGLLLWIFLIIQQKVSLTTVIGKYQEFKLYLSC
jgi:hypothetical protein